MSRNTYFLSLLLDHWFIGDILFKTYPQLMLVSNPNVYKILSKTMNNQNRKDSTSKFNVPWEKGDYFKKRKKLFLVKAYSRVYFSIHLRTINFFFRTFTTSKLFFNNNWIYLFQNQNKSSYRQESSPILLSETIRNIL